MADRRSEGSEKKIEKGKGIEKEKGKDTNEPVKKYYDVSASRKETKSPDDNQFDAKKLANNALDDFRKNVIDRSERSQAESASSKKDLTTSSDAVEQPQFKGEVFKWKKPEPIDSSEIPSEGLHRNKLKEDFEGISVQIDQKLPSLLKSINIMDSYYTITEYMDARKKIHSSVSASTRAQIGRLVKRKLSDGQEKYNAQKENVAGEIEQLKSFLKYINSQTDNLTALKEGDPNL